MGDIGDDRDVDKWETGFNERLPDFWATAKAAEPMDDGAPKAPSLFQVKVHEGASLAPQQIFPQGAVLLEIGESRRMTPAGYERDIRHFSLITKDKDLPFDLGDAGAVYYDGSPDLP